MSEEPTTMMLITMGAMAAGTAVSAASQASAAGVQGDTAVVNSRLAASERISQAQMAERQAQAADFAAEAEREATAFDIARQQEQGEAFKAQQRVDVAGSGLEATGSPLLVMAETAKQIELDRLAIQHAGDMRAREAEDEARLLRYQGEQLRKGVNLTLDIGRYQARAAKQAGNIGVAQSILSGGSKMATAYMYGMG